MKKINDSPIYDTETMLVDGKEFDKLVDTFNALEAELTVKLRLTERGHAEIKDKHDLIHNTMKIVASTESGVIREILGE